MSKKSKCVVLGVTGSIAAYKSAELTSLLVKQGPDVFTVMTTGCRCFITPLPFKTLSHHPVATSSSMRRKAGSPGTSTWPIERICSS